MHRSPLPAAQAHRRAASIRLHRPVALWLCGALSTLSVAQAANPLVDAGPRNVELLLVLLAGVGVLVIAAAVLAFAVREIRREAEQRRRTFLYRRRAPHGTPPSTATRGD